tara:strand:- start:142149 stop:143582 length:1434 start_codon:yes stop_codon:yes gene_type:complete
MRTSRHTLLLLSMIFGLGCAMILGIGCASMASAADRPNIVVFISDDLGRLDTSVHGSPDARTPTMDLLAESGMVFDNAYVASPSCCPNRFSLLTGLMPSRHGAHPNHSQVKPGTSFLPPMFQRLGYHVASFGKVAHGRSGFDGCDFNSPPPRDMSVNVKKHFAGKSIDQPICLFVGDRRPHVAWTKDCIYDPEKITLPSYLIDTPETRQHWARYLSDVTGMDQEMGRIYRFAQQSFGDNFIFLFTSDHGGQWPRAKWNLYDAGTRVPLMACWPNHIAPGTRTDAMVSWVDILPTLIDLVGGEAPSDIDGRSFKDVLLGNDSTHRDKIFTTHTGDGEMNIFPMRSVRVGNFKYIHNLCPDAYHTNHSDRDRKDGAGAYWDSWDAAAAEDSRAAAIIKAYYTRVEHELFDLDDDPSELRNLAKLPEHQSRLHDMQQQLAEWTKQQGDDLLPHREPYPNTQPLPDLRTQKKQRRKSVAAP